jgi:hypothetical protein
MQSLINPYPERSNYKTCRDYPVYPIYKVKESENLSTENVPCIYANIINVGSIDTKNVSINEFRIKYKYKSKDPVYNHIINLIFKGIQVPEHWVQEGVNPPNMEAKTIAQNVCFNLYDDYSLIPIRFAPTKAEGIFVYYKNFINNRALLVEVYNNLEMAALVNDETNKKILYSEDIKSSNFISVIEKLIEN